MRHAFILAYGPDNEPNVPDVVDEEVAEQTPPDAKPDEKKPADKKFSQEDLNRLLADERRKLEKQNKQVITQLENLKKNSELTSKQKEELENRIEQLQNSFLTKEELAKKEQEKLAKQYSQEKETLANELSNWKTRYADETVKRSIMDAAVVNEAYNPDQIVEILRTKTSLTEDVDEEGKPQGSFTPKVKFKSSDKEGKTITLDLTVPEAIKHMKDTPEKWGNLFKSGVSGGIGATTKPGGKRGLPDFKDPVAYREWRKKNPNFGQ